MEENTEVTRGLFKLYESFMSDEEYEASNCISYSVLKDIHDNPEVLITKKEPSDKEWLTFGTLVDIMLTAPDTLEAKVFVNDKVPSDQFKAMAEYIVSSYPNRILSELSDAEIENIYTASGSQVNWLVATKRKKIIEECTDYVKLLIEHKDKLIVTTDLFVEARKSADTFLTHPWTSKYFMSEEQQKKENIEIYYQYKIKYEFEGIKCKSKLDIVFIDHDMQTVEICEIKTGTYSHRKFVSKALYDFKYGYQGALYKEGMDSFLSNIPDFDTYLVFDFRFLYVSRLKPSYPVILEMNQRCHSEFKLAGIDTIEYSLPSLEALMEEVKFYFELINNGETSLVPYDYVKNKGVVRVGALDDSTLY